MGEYDLDHLRGVNRFFAREVGLAKSKLLLDVCVSLNTVAITDSILPSALPRGKYEPHTRSFGLRGAEKRRVHTLGSRQVRPSRVMAFTGNELVSVRQTGVRNRREFQNLLCYWGRRPG